MRMDRRRDRQTDMTKWMVTNPSFDHTPKNIPLFCDMMPCKLVYGYQIFRGFCCLHLQGRTSPPKRWYLYIKLHCVLTQKTGICFSIIVTTSCFVRFKNLTVPELVKKKFPLITQIKFHFHCHRILPHFLLLNHMCVKHTLSYSFISILLLSSNTFQYFQTLFSL
jgi:hypothetical protein